MKYLKKFESINKYKEGDYVLIKTMDKYEPYCKITSAKSGFSLFTLSRNFSFSGSMDDYDPEVDIKQIQYTAEIFKLNFLLKIFYPNILCCIGVAS